MSILVTGGTGHVGSYNGHLNFKPGRKLFSIAAPSQTCGGDPGAGGRDERVFGYWISFMSNRDAFGYGEIGQRRTKISQKKFGGSTIHLKTSVWRRRSKSL